MNLINTHDKSLHVGSTMKYCQCNKKEEDKACPKKNKEQKHGTESQDGCCKRDKGFQKFLREFRRQRCGMSASETFMKATWKWKCMSKCERNRYVSRGCRPKPRKCKRRRKCRCKLSHSEIKKEKKEKNDKKDTKEKKIFSPFANFMRKFRETNMGLSPKTLIKVATRRWFKMSPLEKMNYKTEEYCQCD
ncbi:uncharacterized protein LOC119670051 [Teleopsis dalmanni]|uniref:uncharacterized protein LOC119670051 n=1 Tax=Teleopsis dalmanni TaxID=139649 RepID=UPI0018CDE54B|nr:uncharacterized protein LOC119670051 [Teleopsis dalmanni]XP_037936083.1 uncharacterized protein LOC119670051 [Teleopsis dalmanni]